MKNLFYSLLFVLSTMSLSSCEFMSDVADVLACSTITVSTTTGSYTADNVDGATVGDYVCVYDNNGYILGCGEVISCY